jgi:hypothetical protein
MQDVHASAAEKPARSRYPNQLTCRRLRSGKGVDEQEFSPEGGGLSMVAVIHCHSLCW